MKITIDEKVCTKHKMTVPEVLIALALRQVGRAFVSNMLAREILVEVGGELHVTQHWSDVLDEILCDSSATTGRTEEELTQLAIKIQECFPNQKMRDRYGRETPYYYRCNKPEIRNKLKKFFERYGNYSDEDIVEATKRYVASFNGNYTGMRLAKYFIWKDDIKPQDDGLNHVEVLSDLATFLENKDSEEGGVVVNTENWLSKVV